MKQTGFLVFFNHDVTTQNKISKNKQLQIAGDATVMYQERHIKEEIVFFLQPIRLLFHTDSDMTSIPRKKIHILEIGKQ